MIDHDLKEHDIQNLNDANAVAEFFTKLQYDTSERLRQSPAHLGITESLHPDINKCERIADQEGFLQVYLFELRSVTVAATKTIARALKNKVGNYLLVLTSDYERIDFVLLERIRPEQEERDKVRKTPSLTQANVRPRVLTVNRRKPTRVDLRVLRRFTYTETDAFAQYDKLVSAFGIADWSEEQFNNRALFSDYYLKERLPSEKEWHEDPKPSYLKLKDVFESAREKWSNQPEKELRAGMLQPIFAELGFSFKAGKKAGDDKAEPDYFLFESGQNSDVKNALSFCLAYPWDRYLDGKDYTRDAESPEENPGQLVLSLLQREEADWAVVTNGKVWRLYSAKTHSRASNYYEVDLEEVLSARDPEMFRYFWLMFRAHAFQKCTVTVEGQERETTFLEQLLEGSQQYAKELGERLKERVFNNIFPHFAKGFVEYRRNLPALGEQPQKQLFDDSGQLQLKAEAGDKYLNDIYQTTLTFLYRLLFLLYSEARDLLPVKEERGYWEKSLTKLKNEIAEAAGIDPDGREQNLKKQYSNQQTKLYDRLLAVFKVIDKGQASINVPVYNGGLFITEPKADDNSDEARHAKLLNENKIPDRYLALGLDSLARDLDSRTFKLVPIDYKSLGVRHLGSIYEGLLEFRVRIAPEKMAICKGKGKTEVIIPYPEARKTGARILTVGRGKSAVERTLPPGAVYLENDKHERKATGSYYTPDYIVKYIVENTVGPVLQEKFDKLTQKFRDAQQHHRKQQRFAEQKARVSKFAVPEKSLEATLKTYRSLLDELFDVKVLDPAMGSGHFLVEAVDFITDRLIDFLNGFPWNPVTVLLEQMREAILSQMNEQGIAIDRSKLTDVNLLKRHVLKRCIYGVDLNPMAVELAKVSLWLDCFTLGAPLSFLDHHLKCGNSLIGSTIETVKKNISESGKRGPTGDIQIDIFGSQFAGLLQATQGMIHVGELSDVTPGQVRESRTSFLNASQILEPFKEVLDLWTSQYFGNTEARNLFLTAGFPEIRRGWQKEIGAKANATVTTAHEIAKHKRFLHWELEFPEVFFEKGREKDNPGFDAVVGNPPYVSIVGMSKSEREIYCHFFEFYDYRYDTFALMIERALKLINSQNSGFGMIVPSVLMNSGSFAVLREYILSHFWFRNLIYFGDGAFHEAVIPTMVLVLKRPKPESDLAVVKTIHNIENFIAGLFQSAVIRQLAFCESWNYTFNINLTLPIENLFLKLRAQSIEIRELCKTNRGIITGDDRKFLSNEQKSNKWKPVIRGEKIDRYLTAYSGEYVYYAGRDVLHDPSNEDNFLTPKKLFIRRIGDRLTGSYDGAQLYCLDTLYTVNSLDKTLNILYLLSLLNSNLLSEVYRVMIPIKGRTFPEVRIYDFNRLPIRRISFTTPLERRQALAEHGRKLYAEYLALWSATTASPYGVTASLHSKTAQALTQAVEDQPHPVVPAKAGTWGSPGSMDSRVRGNDNPRDWRASLVKLLP
ncbi:MAG: Eco57I restriction-modification methylase domain-containing protein, partial [bacterium]